jgi:hypothetical protein
MNGRDKIFYFAACSFFVLGATLLAGVLIQNTEVELASEPFSFAIPSLPDASALGEYEALDEKPIFVSGRLALRPAPGEGEDISGSLPLPFKLEGIVITGDDQFVMVKDAGALEAVVMHPDEDVGGWVLKEVRRDAAIFQSGTSRRVLRLPDHKKQPADAPGVGHVTDGE